MIRKANGRRRDASPHACRLCGSQDTRLHFRGPKRSHYRDFLHCPVCDMISVPDRQLIDPQAERERYLQHRNDPGDEGYRSFLRNMLDEIVRVAAPGAKGLDYGCGPTAVLVLMLREAGFEMSAYDLYFREDASALTKTYDFITCTETAEHFRDPRAEFRRLDGMLKPGAWLGIMTGMLDDWADFPQWHYHADNTHICYYSARTMGWIADWRGWELQLPRRNVSLFRRR